MTEPMPQEVEVPEGPDTSQDPFHIVPVEEADE